MKTIITAIAMTLATIATVSVVACADEHCRKAEELEIEAEDLEVEATYLKKHSKGGFLEETDIQHLERRARRLRAQAEVHRRKCEGE